MTSFELQRWSEHHRRAFAAMNRDSEVMADLGGPIDRAASDEKFDRYRDAWEADGISRWAVVSGDAFLGYAGVMFRGDRAHPLGPHHEVGWRFRRAAWGRGLATMSARRALEHAWTVPSVGELWSYTSAENARSRKMMDRLGFVRDHARDFTARYPRGEWAGLVWRVERRGAVRPET